NYWHNHRLPMAGALLPQSVAVRLRLLCITWVEQFDCGKAVRLIPGFIENFEALRQLRAFVESEQELVAVVGSEAERQG
ncbi:MAG: hypothetical protein ACK6DX_00720, partial [Acidobacteriota bacterium]